MEGVPGVAGHGEAGVGRDVHGVKDQVAPTGGGVAEVFDAGACVTRRRDTDAVTSPCATSVVAGFRFSAEVISLRVWWYLQYGLSYPGRGGLMPRRLQSVPLHPQPTDSQS